MLKHPVRKIITNSVWQELEPAVGAAKHSQAGAPGAMTDREFLEAVLHLQAHRQPVAGSAAGALATGMPFTCASGALEARGVWQRLWQNLQAEPFAGARALLLDSTTVRAHHHAAGASKKKTPATRLWAALAGD